MLKDLFSNRLIIGALVFAVLSIGGSLLYLQHVERQSTKTLAETEEFVQWWKERNAPPKNGSTEGPMPDETADTGKADTGKADTGKADTGKRIDIGIPDETSDDAQETDNTPDFWSLTPEQQKHIFDQFYVQFGLKPPPLGYNYKWKDVGVPLLDENGNPLLHKIGEPDVRIQMRVGFAPTREEFEKYNQLSEDWGWAEARGDVAEAERLKAELYALEASVQRMRPFVMSISVGDEAAAKASRAMTEKLNATLREHGLEHLISPWD